MNSKDSSMALETRIINFPSDRAGWRAAGVALGQVGDRSLAGVPAALGTGKAVPWQPGDPFLSPWPGGRSCFTNHCSSVAPGLLPALLQSSANIKTLLSVWLSDGTLHPCSHRIREFW